MDYSSWGERELIRELERRDRVEETTHERIVAHHGHELRGDTALGIAHIECVPCRKLVAGAFLPVA